MNNATITELPTTSTTNYRDSVLSAGLFHGTIEDDDDRWGYSPDRLNAEGLAYSARALSIWNEAHNENDRWDAARSSTLYTQAEVDQLRAEIEQLRTEQIKGNDPRLTDFWKEAQEVATEAEYCGVFDNLAASLGGPRRMKTYTMEVPVQVSVTFTVDAEDEEEALAIARSETLGAQRVKDSVSPFNYAIDWDDLQIDA